jgi:signal transduction histidine kinase
MLMVQAGELASREARRRMEEFLGVAAHELRTPLTTIKAGIQLAQRWAKDVAATHGNDASDGKLEAMHKLLARAERQVETLNRLIGDLLDISRIQAGKLHMRMVSCDLIPIVRDAVDGQRQLVEHRTILLDIAEQRETVLVLADAERIAQVVTNYLTNALKYSGLDRPVVVSVNLLAEGQCVRVSVRDEGPGLSSEEQEHVWERFHQVERIKVQSGFDAGLGLGLHISRTIIEHHHGEVGVESTPGEGAAFWFTLPVAQSLSSSATTS